MLDVVFHICLSAFKIRFGAMQTHDAYKSIFSVKLVESFVLYLLRKLMKSHPNH